MSLLSGLNSLSSGLNTATSTVNTMSNLTSGDSLTSAAEGWEQKIDQAQLSKLNEMGQNSVKKTERETAMDGISKASQLQIQF